MTEENAKIEKKLKGYGYDSLCLRYSIARDAQARAEALTIYQHDPERSYIVAKMEKLKFYEILDDLIGEHD